MDLQYGLSWLEQGKDRQMVLAHLKQPVTALQLAHQHAMTLDRCSHALGQLRIAHLLSCLNPLARRSRLYWLTRLGSACQNTVRAEQGLPECSTAFPKIDWNLYGWVCFSHRSAVIKAMHGSRQPSEIKRRALLQDSSVRMSANNVRDVMRLFLAKGIVRPVRFRKKKHLRYELTDLGLTLQRLILNAEF